MAVSAFCPAYATGLFCIGDKDAAGAGFALDCGMETSVSEVKSGRSSITINGMESPAPVSKAVLRRFAELRMGKVGLLKIEHKTEVPIGFGLGMSAAGALSLSYCLNELLGAGLKKEACVKIAHDADVECGTGLSGVDAAAIGGILARRSGKHGGEKLPFEEKEIEVAFFSPIRTSTVIYSDSWKKKVNEAGEKALAGLFENKCWDGFVECSRLFTAKSELGNWCIEEMAGNPRSSMAMVGQTLFSDSKMSLKKRAHKTISAKTSEDGAKLL